jgi:sulfite reductase (NADPH) flavoprotein alpha-component
MTAVPFIPDNAPFSPEQRSWLNGFLAGVLRRSAAPAPAPGASAAVPLLVLFGSQSGNAESLAKKLAKDANARGFAARAAGMDAIDAAGLASEPNVLVITSTWGEGDMPDNAAGLWDQLNQNGSSPRLETMRYSVLALGDRNYADTFCLAGRKVDERLAELGAVRIHPRQDCDVDFEAPAHAWSAGALEALLAAAPAAAPALPAAAPAVVMEERPAGFSKKNPCLAPLLENRLLNARGSAKDTRHIAFALPESGMAYEAGDALGVFATNCPGVVDQVLHAHGLSGDTVVQIEEGPSLPLREALLRHFEIRTLLGTTPAGKVSAQEFLAGLRKLQPRLYSISSSPKAHPGEVHLTVSAVRYELNGIAHKGVASTFLADRLPIGESAAVFVQKSAHFRLPADGSLPVIMVGPGTGIAPFRAFLEERLATGAPGRNWLFFGDQRQATDYLYSEQITEWQRRGHLTRLDLAFSRDQKEKIYVQNRMLEHAAELWQWLEQGAHFYVCGDASRMAKDVDAALHQVIRTAGGKSGDDAAAYVADLKRSKRYLRDVY